MKPVWRKEMCEKFSEAPVHKARKEQGRTMLLMMKEKELRIPEVSTCFLNALFEGA